MKEDGTTTPEFVYSESRGQRPRVSVKGIPFYLDMTYGGGGKSADAYLGFDFGSSNSSVSYVDRPGVTVYKERATNKAWKDIYELAGSLPYPVAVELAAYLSQSRPEGLAKEALSVLESILALVSYGTYQEYRIKKNAKKDTRLFGGFTQRSIGPLWKLLRESIQGLGTGVDVFTPFARFLEDNLSKQFDEVATMLAKVKHEKARESDIDHFRWVHVLANLTNEIFSENKFGYFKGVSKRPFSSPSRYEGIFRCAYGATQKIR